MCRNNNKFKVATTPDTTTLEYHQSIYTHCKQRFNIPDGIEVVKKSVYQYIKNCINNYFFGNYNISEVRSNLYNNLVHYSQLRTEDLNSETLATYFQELNFNIIEYCEEKYPVQPKYSFNFESEIETKNKGKQKVKQYLRTTSNTPILPKTIVKHLQIPEQGTSVKLPLFITPFPILLVQPQTPSSLLNCFSRSEDFQSPKNSTQQQEPILTSANIIDYLQENENNHSESLESKETKLELEEITGNVEEITTAYIAKIPEFTSKDNDTSPQEWLDKVQKAGDANNAFLQQFTDNNTSITLHNCFHNIKQKTSETILNQFIAGLKNKLIKKVCPHAPADLATAIRHAKSYEMAMEEANHTKLVNLAIGETSSAAEEKIDQLTKKVESYFTNQQQQQQQPQRYQPPQHNQNNFGSSSNNHLKIVIIVEFQDTGNEIAGNCKETNKIETPKSKQLLSTSFTTNAATISAIFTNSAILDTTHLTISSTSQKIVPRNSGQQRPNYFHTQPSYLTMTEESNFQQTALSEDKAAVPRTNLSNYTIPPAQIAQNANLLNIFPFEFEANESPFLLSNATANEQKAITAMYTKATLMQQLQKTVNRLAQTVIVTADGMKKTPVGEIDNFLFTIDEITIPVKVLVMDASQYQALVGNDWLLKANANLDWETQELKISYQEQYTIVLATCGACISPEEKYETRTCYFCKACHRERFGSPKRSGKWENTLCLTCGDMLPEECNWIDVAMRGEVCDQTCQYALSISKKVRRGTSFDAAYNSTFNKFYHYPYNAEMIFDLAMTLINEATQEDVCQMKEAKYIEYTIKLAGFDYEDEVETYHQIASHTYPTQEAQIQQLEQMNIQLCEECIMPCDDKWCPEFYALSIPLPKKNDENEIKFGVSELVEELPTTLIYFLEKQLPLQLKYFDNHGQGIRPENVHEIDAGYDLRYPRKDTLVLQPKSLTKINLKITLEIPSGVMIQIAFRSLLASKKINVKGGVINARYTGDITIML
ncbi:hypothetical protein G9A89_008892 [Geosiphon pyriformis]|nr:hypothetical protein G9A89_008892 [Geosiphon pyriformis]